MKTTIDEPSHGGMAIAAAIFQHAPDHEYTNEVVCPHCGHIHTESYEFFSGPEECADGCSCGMCGKEFNAVCHVSIKYSTSLADDGSES